MCSEGVPAVPKYRVLHGSLGSFWRHQWLVGFRRGDHPSPSTSLRGPQVTPALRLTCPGVAVRSRSRPDFQSAELPYCNVKKWGVQSADESHVLNFGT